MKEYNALKILATEGDEQLAQTLDNSALQHLHGYGLIEENGGNLTIRFETIKRFLQGKYKFERKNLSIKEQKQEINTRFDAAEQKLRFIIRDTLRTALGSTNAKDIFLKAMKDNRAVSDSMLDKAGKMTYRQLYDPTMNGGCFFTVLISTIEQNYSLFINIFEVDSDITITRLRKLNRARQLSAHSAPENAENWSKRDFEEFREAITWLESVLGNYD